MTARLLSHLLLTAVHQRRVMIEVPLTQGKAPGRWCNIPPYTMACFWKPWSHCAPPEQREHTAHDDKVDTVHWSLASLHQRAHLWMGRKSGAEPAARRFLFRPRRWVQSLTNCVMEHARLGGVGGAGAVGDFVAVHVRNSVEKWRESWRPLPRVEAYGLIAAAIAIEANLSKVFVQTASPSALATLQSYLKRPMGLRALPRSNSSGVAPTATLPALEASWTDNARNEHDSWGGMSNDSSATMEAGVTAAVNLAVASNAAYFVTLSASMWNHLVASAGGYVATQPFAEWTHIYCGPYWSGDHTISVLARGRDGAERVRRAVVTNTRCLVLNHTKPY